MSVESIGQERVFKSPYIYCALARHLFWDVQLVLITIVSNVLNNLPDDTLLLFISSSGSIIFLDYGKLSDISVL